MAKKKKYQEAAIENYYDLKVDKIEELVAALKDENHVFEDEVSTNIVDCTGDDSKKNYKRNGEQKQFNPYKNDFLSRIPKWLIAIFIKWWFFGVVCYFVNMGLGIFITDTLDLFFLTGLFMGMVVDVLVNPIFKYMETDKKEYDNFIMFPFPFKAFWTFFANMLYHIFVAAGVLLFYMAVGKLFNYQGMEPLSYGLFAIISDMFFIGIKDGVVYLIKKLKKVKVIEDV